MNTLLVAVSEVLKFETALLLLVTAGLLVLAKIVSDLRAEVRSLRGMPVPETKPAPSLQPDAAAVPAQAALPPAAPSAEIPPDVFAAIASAVHFTLGDQHRVVSVSPAESLAWSREGRRSIFRSHTFR